jgi:hypothetical protein
MDAMLDWSRIDGRIRIIKIPLTAGKWVVNLTLLRRKYSIMNEN